MTDADDLDINEKLILSDTSSYMPNRYASSLKDGVNITELATGEGVEFEIDENGPPRDSDDEDVGKNYFDSEEMFQILNNEALGNDNEEDDSPADKPFEHIARDMEDVTNDKGVLKKILRPGVGPVVPKTATLRFHYNAYREFGDEPYDSSRFRGKPESTRLGSGAFPGLDIALSTMRKGELAKFLFKKEYVFKDLGCEPRVPGGTVLWEIELLGFVDHGVLEDINEMPRGDKRKASFKHLLTIANGHKEVGNDLYKRKQVSQAISKYMKAIKLLEECSLQDEKEEKEMNVILLKLYSNMTQCALELGQSARAIKYARKVLYVDPKNVKALFRMGKAYMKESEFDRAREFFVKALRREPNNPDIKNGMIELNRNVESFKQLEKEKCQAMMRKYLSTSDKADDKENEASDNTISQDIQELNSQLNEFVNTPVMQEMVLPSTLTEAEMKFVENSALKMGLKTEIKKLGVGSENVK